MSETDRLLKRPDLGCSAARREELSLRPTRNPEAPKLKAIVNSGMP